MAQSFFVHLRFYGAGWYNAFDLPNADTTRYLVEFVHVRWYHKMSQTKIVAQCPILNKERPANHYFIRAYGSMKVPPPLQ